MNDIPKELIPVIVQLWMNLHTAARRGLIDKAFGLVWLVTACPNCGEKCLSLRVHVNGVVLALCRGEACDWITETTIDQLMPSAPNGVGIADYEVRK